MEHNSDKNPEEHLPDKKAQEAAITEAHLSQSHMGAVEEEMQHLKPPTSELADLTHKKGDATAPKADEYNPRDEITPG